MITTQAGISRTEISEVLSKIRAFSEQNKAASLDSIQEGKSSQFSGLLSLAKNALTEVNQVQQKAETLQHAYLSGDLKVPISQVMVSSMQSKLAFEGLLVVKAKLLDAYKEIMNMPV